MSVSTVSTVCASVISFKNNNKKSLDFKIYAESELSFFDTEVGTKLKNNMIFQQTDDDCASDDEGVDYGKNRTLKSLK